MGLFDWLPLPSSVDAETAARVEQTVAAVDPMLGTVSGYQRRLAPAVGRAWDYCGGLAGCIPGPFDVDRAAFSANPLIHALFGSPDQIEAMLARSACIRDFLKTPDQPTADRCYALLGMRRQERSGFGATLVGDVLRQDVAQRLLYFVDHTLIEPSPDVAAVRQRLHQTMFTGLLKGFSAHVEDVRRERAGLYQAQAMEGVRLRVGADTEIHTRRLTELRQRLLASVDALSPPRLLESLAACLEQPEPYLHLEPLSLWVDRLGVIRRHGGDLPLGADRLDFVELSSRDPRRWVVIIARIDREEAERAVERFEEAKRHIVL